MKTDYKIIKRDHVFKFNPQAIKCPICGGRLTGYVEGWEQDEKGLWKADDVKLDCENMPEFDSDDWNDWFNGHYSMPYVDWMPLQMAITTAVNKKYRFDLES